jgi:GT2 family glycosyltransferase
MTAATAPAAATTHAPSVLVVLVVRNAAEWLRECLQALATQTYPRLGIVAIDDGSRDGSHEILVQALGEGRVVRRRRSIGLARAFDEALSLPVVGGADYLLLLHDDAALDPDAVTRMVEATQLPGAERAGIVGAKIVDWGEPRRLVDVGRSADRFGHPYSPLQQGEIDQGQFDRVLEVLMVDCCAVLVARDVWQQVQLFDERLGDDDGDLDLCWRARVAGWRVLMTPLARVRHLGAGERDDRPDPDRSRRYEEDRAALAAVLKNYSLPSLLLIVPLGIVLAVIRFLYLLLSRRFEEAYDIAAAVGWNVVHLPSTLLRRRRVQRARRTRDRELRRFTRSAGLRLPRWFQTAEQIFEEQREFAEDDEGEPAGARIRHRTASFLSTHPVLAASFFGVVVGVLAARHVLGADQLAGGALPAFPAGGFLDELVSGYRSTGLGGALAASPALGALAGLEALMLGNATLAQTAILIGAPLLAAVLCYRAAVRLTGRPGPAVVAAAGYALSAIALWAFSDGRIGLLVALIVLPPLIERTEVAFSRQEPSDGRWRFVAGLGVTLAVGIAFEPGILLAFTLLVAVHVVAGPARLRGLARSGAALVGAGVLLFPFVPTLLAGGGVAFGSRVGSTDPWAVLRLAVGDAPGAWVVAGFLPIAAVLSLALTRITDRAIATRTAAVAAGTLGLAWLSGAGYLPAAVANAPVYLALSASAQAFLVAFGLTSVVGALGREAFGFRQIGTALLTVTLVGGIGLQAAVASLGGYAVGGPEQIPAAWAVVDSAAVGHFRVLWIGGPHGGAFPAPGGDPQHIVEAGDATLRYAITGRGGAQAVDLGRPVVGPGADALHTAMAEILSGSTAHGGALLAPFGVRYVVARQGDVPDAALDRLLDQSDFDAVPATELVILRNAVVLTPAAAVDLTEREAQIVASGRPSTTQRLRPVRSASLEPVQGGWTGPTGGGSHVLLSTEYDGAWRLDGSAAPPERAFGWSTMFSLEDQGFVRVRYGAQLPRTVAVWLLAAAWAAALWITRRPVQR